MSDTAHDRWTRVKRMQYVQLCPVAMSTVVPCLRHNRAGEREDPEQVECVEDNQHSSRILFKKWQLLWEFHMHPSSAGAMIMEQGTSRATPGWRRRSRPAWAGCSPLARRHWRPAQCMSHQSSWAPGASGSGRHSRPPGSGPWSTWLHSWLPAQSGLYQNASGSRGHPTKLKKGCKKGTFTSQWCEYPLCYIGYRFTVNIPLCCIGLTTF